VSKLKKTWVNLAPSSG